MTDRQPPSPTRRRMLAGVGTAIGVTLGGCTGDSDTADPDSGDSGGGDSNAGDSDTGDSGSGDEDSADSDSDADDSSADDSDADAGDSTGEGPDCAGESVHDSYGETRVRVTTPEGEELGSVTAAIADTSDARRTGLSETDCLPPGRGMLFVYDRPRELNFWMIDMDFGIDIVYIDGEGTITSIYHADAPGEDESGTEEHHQYPGEGQYVLEVVYGWTTEHDVAAGDVVEFDR